MKKLSTLTATALAAIALTACGGSGDESTPTTSTTAVPVTTTTTAPVITTSTTAASLPALADGGFVGTFTNLDTAAQTATFTSTCGDGRTYRANLRNATFTLTSNPDDPAASHAIVATFAEWAPLAGKYDWSVRKNGSSLTLTNGPSDISCD